MLKRIAIVEDDSSIRKNYADALVRGGYEVEAFGLRSDARNAFRTRLPDLAVIDIGLGSDTDGGFTLGREFRAMSATLPSIFLTAPDSGIDSVSGLRLGGYSYV